MENETNETWNEIETLKGRTIKSVEGLESYSGEVIFTFTDDSTLRMYHWQECCESVSLIDFDSLKPEDLVGGTIVLFEEYTKEGNCTMLSVEQYTFYRMRTTKSDMTMRWYGESNGYYGVSVSCVLEDKDGNEIYDD